MIKNQKGFTLIELMITVAIIGIITAIAWPEYERNKTKNRRTDGINALMKASQKLQQCHTDKGGYIDKFGTICTYTALSKEEHFTISTITLTVDEFQLRATPSMTDEECSTLTLTNLGVKGFTGSANVNRCWSQ